MNYRLFTKQRIHVYGDLLCVLYEVYIGFICGIIWGLIRAGPPPTPEAMVHFPSVSDTPYFLKKMSDFVENFPNFTFPKFFPIFTEGAVTSAVSGLQTSGLYKPGRVRADNVRLG